MAVFLKVDNVIYCIGELNFTLSFFDTIHCLLEKGEQGSVYPHVMGDFFDGRIAWQDVPRLKEELDDIHLKLSAFPPSAVVWDKDDPGKKPPWGDDISDDITDMSNYYVTADGRDLFEVLNLAINRSIKEKKDLRIVSSVNGFK